MAVTAARTPRRRPGRRLLAHDRDLGARLVAGADEAGRGSLAGPLVARRGVLRHRPPARVALRAARPPRRLQAPHRGPPRGAFRGGGRRAPRRWRCASSRRPRSTAAAFTGRTCTRSGEALCALDPEPDVCLTDGFPVPGCARAHRAVVGGDGRSAAIAAASIVAKVTRDRFMRAHRAALSRVRVRAARRLHHARAHARCPRARPDAASPAVVRGDRLCAARSRPLSTAGSPRPLPPRGCGCAATGSWAGTSASPGARSTSSPGAGRRSSCAR